MKAEDDIEDPPPDALPGGADSKTERPTDDLIQELIGGVAQLHVLLGEADEEEFRRIEYRLKVLVGLVANLPETITLPERRTLGFKPKAKRRGRG